MTVLTLTKEKFIGFTPGATKTGNVNLGVTREGCLHDTEDVRKNPRHLKITIRTVLMLGGDLAGQRAFEISVRGVDYKVFVAESCHLGRKIDNAIEEHNRIVDGDYCSIDKELNVIVLEQFPAFVHSEILESIYNAGAEFGKKEVQREFKKLLNIA